jgi:dipeptidyl aminopeptidase/acylaminoacyl peptidase
MMKVKTVGNVRVSPDGRRVVYTASEAVMTDEKSEYLTHIYMANADGSDAFQFTYGDKSGNSPKWSPDGRWIAFTSSRSSKDKDKEKENIWLIRADGGEAQQLTDGKSNVTGFEWSPDGKTIAFTMPDPPTDAEEKAEKGKNDARVVDENLKMNRLWVIPAQKDATGKREARLLTTGEFNVVGSGEGGFDWSPDGQTIVFTHWPTPRVNDWPLADISTVDVASGEVKPLAHTTAAETSPLYSPDGRWIAYNASDNPPTWGTDVKVSIISASGGLPRELAETIDRQPDLIGWSADGQQVYFTEARGTITRLSALPVNGGPPQDLDRGDGVMAGAHLNASRTMLGFTLQTATRPPEAYVSRLDRIAPVQVSRVNTDLPNDPLGRTEVVRWTASDGLDIEGLLTYPVGYKPGTRYPLLLIIHGGPTGVFRQAFIANYSLYPIAAFASQGYAVLRCNIRGSSGYGKKFRYADYKDWGGMDYQDLMAGVDHVIKMGVADGDRLGVMGWSYGGYMTSWIITQTKRFKAASVGAGVTNLMSFTGTADIPSFIPDYFGVEFWNNLDPYRTHSAMFNIKGVSTPTLIQHGERDERVPISQGYELYNALKRQGNTVKMVVYPRTPHGPREPKLILDVMKRNVEWFGQYLRQEVSVVNQ